MNVTVCVVFAGTVTFCVTVIGEPVGGVTVADTTPVCEVVEVLVTSVLTVSAELLRSAAVFWLTCALPTISGAAGLQLDRELDAGVVVRRDLGPVDVVEREHRGRDCSGTSRSPASSCRPAAGW